MRNGIAAILVAAVMIVGWAASAPADSQIGHGTMSGSSDGASSSGSADSSNSDDAPPFAPMSVEGWDGGAYRLSNGGIYCELSDDYGSGVSMLVGWDQNGFYLMVTDPNTLKMDALENFETVVSVDKTYRAKVKAFAYDTDQLELDFYDDRKGISALRKGVKLVLEDWDHWYTLYGTNAAIAAVEDCFNRYR
jgi:hypothetical protein